MRSGLVEVDSREVKVKKLQTMECVVGGSRTHPMIDPSTRYFWGLYDENQNLRYVGGTKLMNTVGEGVSQ